MEIGGKGRGEMVMRLILMVGYKWAHGDLHSGEISSSFLVKEHGLGGAPRKNINDRLRAVIRDVL